MDLCGVVSSGNGTGGGRVEPEAVEASGTGGSGGRSDADTGGLAERGSKGAIDGGSRGKREPTVKNSSPWGSGGGGDAEAPEGGAEAQGPAGIVHGGSSKSEDGDSGDDDDVGGQAVEPNRGRVWLGSHAAGGRIARGEPHNLPLTVGPHAAPSAPFDSVVVAPAATLLLPISDATEGHQQPSELSSLLAEEGRPGAPEASDLLARTSAASQTAAVTPDGCSYSRRLQLLLTAAVTPNGAVTPDAHQTAPPPPDARPVPQPPAQQTVPPLASTEHPAFPSPARVHRIGSGACDALLKWLVRHYISLSVPNAKQVS